MQVHKIGVVGAGQMGQGIAQVAAQAGLDVVIVEAAPDFAAMGIGGWGQVGADLEFTFETPLSEAVRPNRVTHSGSQGWRGAGGEVKPCPPRLRRGGSLSAGGVW